MRCNIHSIPATILAISKPHILLSLSLDLSLKVKEGKMLLQSYILPLFIILISFPNCLSSFQENPLPNNLDKTSGYDPKGYSAFVNGGPDDDSVPNFFKHESTETFHVRRLAQVGAYINVNNFGAKGDGRSDDTQAFKKAWKAACSSRSGVFVVPQNRNYLLKPITFSGPCNSAITMKIYGTLVASSNPSDYKNDRLHWLLFDNIQNIKVEGGGTINGNGKIWWENSCKVDKSRPCKHAPTAVTFLECTNLKVSSLTIKDAQQMHLIFEKCVNVRTSNLMVTAPETSPNTDGIHVTGTQNIQITKSVIRTGDDCISIVSGSRNVQAMDITCGPGHGISIGSLGSDNSAAYVSDVTVDGARLSGTTNGVRIKTWQGGHGYAKNIKFQNIVMDNVSNPIIVDQNYCDQDSPCHEQASAVQVKNVAFKNIRGTSASEVAIKLDCSKSVPCQGIILQDINLKPQEDGKAEASCEHVIFSSTGKVSPNCASS